MADPSSPVPAPEDTPAPKMLIAWLDFLDECDPETADWKAARAALVDLYTNRREEMFEIENPLNGEVLRCSAGTLIAELRSQVERMKADVLTPEEARGLLADPAGSDDPLYEAWCAAIIKIRRRRSSDNSDAT